MTDTTITYLRRADHDPGSDWPDFYREEKIAEGAGLRHESRCVATHEAALAFAAITPEELHSSGITGQRIAEILIALDSGGVGGPRGYSGGATRRMPWAARLGSGRWQAGDGAAWAAASEHHTCSAKTITPEEAGVIFTDDLFDGPSREWPWALACRRVVEARTPEEAASWDAVRMQCLADLEEHREDEEAVLVCSAIEAGLLRGLTPEAAREGVQTTPLGLSYLLDKAGPSAILDGDVLSDWTTPEELAAAGLLRNGWGGIERVDAPDDTPVLPPRDDACGPKVEIIRRRLATV